MTAITSFTELSVEDVPINVVSGTAKRRKKVYIRATTTGATDTIDITQAVPDAADIEGLLYDTLSNAVAATATTWSGTVITTAGATTSAVVELGVLVNVN